MRLSAIAAETRSFFALSKAAAAALLCCYPLLGYAQGAPQRVEVAVEDITMTLRSNQMQAVTVSPHDPNVAYLTIVGGLCVSHHRWGQELGRVTIDRSTAGPSTPTPTNTSTWACIVAIKMHGIAIVPSTGRTASPEKQADWSEAVQRLPVRT